MSACAGSLTDASRSAWMRCCLKGLALGNTGYGPDIVSGDRFWPQERYFSSISPAWSRWIAPGRIGFMSTQRREDHLRLALCKDRAGSWGIRFLCLLAREFFAIAAGRTAPPESPARTATNSLSSDHHNQQPVRLVFIDIRIGSPPVGKTSRQRPSLGHPRGYPFIPSFADRARPIRPCRVYRQP